MCMLSVIVTNAHARIQRGGGGGALKITKIGFLSNTGSNLLKKS